MKLPKSISILGRNIEVVELDESEELKNDKGEALGGYYAHHERRIYTDKNAVPVDKFDNLCHESAHAAIIFTGWDQKLNKREIELLCQLMTMFTGDIIKAFSNPKRKKPMK